MFKKTIFQLHWFFGITAGLVLAVMGVTGAAYSYQGELLRLLNPQMISERRDGQILPLEELVQRAESEGRVVAGAWLPDLYDGSPLRLMYTPPPGERRGESVWIDPYTGELLGEMRGEDFFGLMLVLHRFLAAGQTGKQITAASTLILLFFCLSGLYLRWPRKALSWRAWLTLDWARKGRAFNWDLHAVAGTWCLALYLLAALTGLTWSYGWYREAAQRLLGDPPAAGEQRRERGRPGPSEGPPPQVDYRALWNTLGEAAEGRLGAFSLRIPQGQGEPMTVFMLRDDADHIRAFDQVRVEPESGRLLGVERYLEKSTGERLLSSIYALHTGEYFGAIGRALMFAASLAMPLFLITGWLLYLDRRRKKRAARASRAALGSGGGAGERWLVAFASQSGSAEQLAWSAAGQLQSAGALVEVLPLQQLDGTRLGQYHRALFSLATFGEGEAPDHARAAEKRLLGQSLDLSGLRYAVLALGDRQYEHFCGFARRVDAWLSGCGALALFDSVEVDDGEPAAIARWQAQLASFGGAAPLPILERPFDDWTLLERELLNPGSAGASTWRVSLAPPADAHWQAGDILEVAPRHPFATVDAWLQRLGLAADARVQVQGLSLRLDEALRSRELPPSLTHLVGQQPQTLVDELLPLAGREYSIASLAEDGVLELIVRQAQRPDGSLGLGSGWLTQHAVVGEPIAARLRRNSSFHAPQEDVPMILIGSGTGLAGLRSLLRQRVREGRSRNWLLFGERNAACDFYCAEEIRGWQASGALQRLDLAFSRDPGEHRYVQHALAAAGDELRQWLNEGAAIYVCGSLVGMAGGVDQALTELLGEEGVAHLLESGRYRRDVY